nr:type II/IV secretion system protein [uncultured Desulfobacter sp.]
MAVSETALIDAGIRVGLVPADTINTLKLQAKREKLKLIEMVTRTCRFPQSALYRALADTRQMPFLQAADLVPDHEVMKLLPGRTWSQRLILPVKGGNSSRTLALSDPDDRLSLDRVSRAAGVAYVPALAEPDVIRAAIDRAQAAATGRHGEAKSGDGIGGQGTDPVSLLDDIMKEVYLRRASDVHFEPGETGMRIRLRVDGQMQELFKPMTRTDEEGLLNRVKVLSGLDIAEQRKAQDGAMSYEVMDWDIPETDIRVATVPTRWGERCTMRILGQDTDNFTLEDLGMPPRMLEDFRNGIRQPYGMILVTGPTGSGKSTTLYAALRELPVEQINILTAEDPVEQTIDGISQVQISSKVSFAQALRSFLRHDPDVILVGEIRDQETVEIGLRAAMTGHLVLSTLHTNDAIGAVTRLADVGAERFLIGSTLIGVMAQRLTRRMCPHCRKKRPATPEELEILGLAPDNGADLYEPQGCSFCLGSGFKGRMGLFEALWITPELGTIIAEGAGENQIRNSAKRFKSLWQDCVDKVLAGKAALSEVIQYRPQSN